MIHLGDITKINGAEIEPVDVIVGGSPCQDLSVAGKRAGLEGQRSGLFMEQIRVIKEMRNATARRSTGHVQPRYMVWENVPGAFSSNKAEDFRIVLEETARIANSNAVIPRPPGGKWTTAGCIMGNGWSIAWRVQDAQFWGVPQRRRRIALVADFGGLTAPEILFEREGVSGDIEEIRAEREGTAGNVESGFGETGAGYWQPGIQTLRAEGENRPSRPSNVVVGFSYKASAHAGTIGVADECAPSLLGARQDAAILEPVTYPGVGITSKENASKGTPGVCHTLNQDSRNYVVPTYCIQGDIARGAHEGQNGSDLTEDVSYTLNTIDVPAVCAWPDVAMPVMERYYKGPRNYYNGGLQGSTVQNMSVRRLTPLECERLQGYPDGWTDIIFRGKPASDSARYKALGNSIALPPWRFVLSRIYQHGARSLGSLFDGIGGFLLIWSELQGTSTPWASEIEPFPIAVTEYKFNKQEVNHETH